MGLNETQKKERSEYLEHNLVITECSQKKPFVFISYASDNWERVFKSAVVPMQREYGLSVYADKAFDKVNDKWIVPMLRNIRGADVIVAFVSQSYIESYACFLEMLTAVNNKKPIVFVSLEDELHLGDTTDQPNVERGVKNEILNQGANIATNTNNTSNDIMRAMKSAFTSISTLLEQDALSKYDISDAFINFFRDASINRKTINDLNAVRGTIESVSNGVFDTSVIEQLQKKAVPVCAGAVSGETVSENESVKDNAVSPAAATEAKGDSGTVASPGQSYGENGVNNEPSADTVSSKETSVSGINKIFGNKKIIIVAAVCLAAVICAVIGVSGGSKNVTDMAYSYVNEKMGETLSGTYTGEWKNKKPEGKGTMQYYNGTVYEGDWVNGMSEGWGIAKFSNGDVYEGEFKNDLMDGKGVMTFANGNVYEGEVSENMKNGHGVLTYASGDVYEGEFANDNMYGHGILTYADGSVYDGEWMGGMRHGQCTDTFANGDVYEGEFTNDSMTGRGKMTYANGEIYEGEFAGGKKSGQGTMTYADGGVYTGSWAEDKREGNGFLTGADGHTYDGEWSNGSCDGKGVYTYADGTVVEGIWKNGKYIGDESGFGPPDNISFAPVSDKNETVEISWDPVPGASKYQLYIYFNPEHKDCEASIENESTSINLNNTKEDYYYYFTLRSVKTGEDKVSYSDWTYIRYRCKDGQQEYYWGGWNGDKMDGHGTMEYMDGGSYEGEWADGLYNGQGVRKYASGTVSEGTFKDGKLNGEGKIIIYESGNVYEGTFIDDMLNGEGRIVYKDGSVSEGTFKDSRLNGQGIFTNADGTVQSGTWSEGKFVE